MVMKPKFIKHTFTAVFGCLTGILYERFRKRNFNAFSVEAVTITKNKKDTEEFVVHNNSLVKTENLVKDENQTLSISKHGFPSLDNIKNYKNFIVSYDRRNRNANWVLEHLTPEDLIKKKEKVYSRFNLKFYEDNNIHEYFRSTNEDFKDSNYDRGHLAAAANHNSNLEHLKNTFVLTNISPQVGKGFNRDIWNSLEKYVRFRTRFSKNTWVCTGPLYLPRKGIDGKNYVIYEVIGKNNIAVPTHFFKILLIENLDGTLELESYLIENAKLEKKIHLKSFQIPISYIERASGLLVFDKIPKDRLKSINGPNIYLEKFVM